MKKIVCFTFITLFFSSLSFGQIETSEPVSIDKRNIQFYIDNNVSYYLDSTRALQFKDIKKLPFKASSEPLLDDQSKTWYKFYIQTELKVKTLIFSPSHVDSSNVYLPYHNGYKEHIIGRLTDKKAGFSVFDKSILYVPIDSIDFSKPFYYNKVILTKTGKGNADNSGYVVLTNNISIWKNKKDKRIGYSKTPHVFLAAISIAMLIFFVNYFVTKDKNFLNYSLYLFFTILIFSSNFSFFVNLVNDIHPLSIDSIAHASVILASVSYFYFVVYFLDVKHDFPKIYPLTKYTIIGSLIFAAFSVFQMFFLPYLNYRYDILRIYDIAFVIISIVVFVYLVWQPLTLVKRIVILGSFLLIIGQLLSLVTGNAYYFIYAVCIEIIAFSSVVSFQNKITSYNRLVSENALQKEKKERENLQELTQLKSRFITNITHEFRTPLTIIQGYVDNLNEQFNADKKVTSSLNTIKQSSNNLLNLVNQMLDLDALENKKLSINLIQDDVVSYTLKIINGLNNLALEKQINIDFKTNEAKILMDFDEEKLRQILSNLISNAIKFSPEDSEIKIKLNKLEDHTLKIEVIDQGYGIAKKDMPFIFNRFYQVESDTQKVYQGTGIGLALTKELVELLEGTIKVTSILGNGSTFTIALPITNAAAKNDFSTNVEKDYTFDASISELDEVINHENTNTVLIVEDNVDMANFIASCLQLDYNVIFAKDGRQGLEFAELNIPDIIITDIMMPFVDGFELIQKLQENPNTNHIPIIALTAKSKHKDKLEGISSGADVYLTKPFEKDELVLRAQMLIAKRKQLQERYKVNTVIENKQNNGIQSDKNLIFLNTLIDAIHKHIDYSGFGAKELAKHLAMSDSQLYRKLKAISDTSTALFIRKVRLEKSKELLENSGLSISEVAYATGFNDPKWFSKAFKGEFKVNPSEYRN